jgi:hypothetical protein
MEVRVIHQDPTGAVPDSDYVRVSTCSDPNDDTVTLATIQRVVDRTGPEEPQKPKQRVKTLVLERPMSVDEAVGLATCYAERKKIPIVYAKTA